MRGCQGHILVPEVCVSPTEIQTGIKLPGNIHLTAVMRNKFLGLPSGIGLGDRLLSSDLNKGGLIAIISSQPLAHRTLNDLDTSLNRISARRYPLHLPRNGYAINYVLDEFEEAGLSLQEGKRLNPTELGYWAWLFVYQGPHGRMLITPRKEVIEETRVPTYALSAAAP